MNNIAGGRSAEEIRITGAGSELQGVGRLSDGRAVFVPGALPGETVRAEIVRAAKRYCEARLVEVLDPSPERRAPDCPHYGVCGGCQGRHMTYAETLRLKRGRVRDALVRIGGLDSPEVFPVIGCNSPDRTRNKAEFPIGRDAGGRIAIGAHMAGSRTVVPLDDCLLQKPAAVRAMRWLSERLDGLGCARHLTNLVTRVNRRGELMAVLCADAPVESAVRALVPEMVRALPELRSLYFLLQNRRPSHALDGRCMHLWGQRALDDELMGLTFSLSPQSFFQVNAEQAERLYEVALAAVGLGAEDARAHHQPEAGCAAPRTGSEMADSSLPAGRTPARDASARMSHRPEAGCAASQTGSELGDSSLPAGQTPARDASARVSHQPEAGCAVPQTGSEMADSSLPAGQTPARDASVRVSHQPEAGCAVPQTELEMADSSLPAGRTSAQDASVRVSHQPEAGCAASQTGSEMGDSSLPAGQTLARDASVRVPHRPEAGCAASQTGSEMGDSSLPAGRTSARDASVRISHQPEAGYAVPQTELEMADSSLPAGQTPARDVEVRVLDAYCGVGTIALAAARRACDVLGVEIVAPAVADAVQNARRNGMDGRTRFVCADAASEIPRRIARGERFDAVILDPPRKGADEKLLRALLLAAPPRIVYVSCDPATLARDVRILCEGGYRFDCAQPVDMFPWTGHVECVVLMSKVKE